MQLQKQQRPLALVELPVPKPAPGQILIRVSACGVCRTDLHVLDGDLPNPKLPLILGHEIVGRVEALGAEVDNLKVGQRVGVPWLGGTDGTCFYCRHGEENLCDHPQFTGYTVDGGYAQYTLADCRFAVALPEGVDDIAAAPLLCAGLIGWRSLGMTGEAQRLGLYGFGAAAHIIAQVALHQGRQVFGFTRDGDEKGQEFARSLGAVWAGGSSRQPPELLDAAIIFAPVGPLVPLALTALRKGGRLVLGGIHMSDIPQFPYDLLWEERSIKSVANLTRKDAEQFFAQITAHPVKTTTTTYPLTQANRALADLRGGKLEGAAVLDCR
ncbi:MAG TPA: zinc-dependent alcohol dehydrogenase family protein [Candidatus Obscuribacterales bacterium]